MQWQIVQLERQTQTGGVVVAHWRCEAEQDGASAAAYGSVSFTPDPDADDYVPYDELTQDDVLDWVYSSVDKDETESALQAQLDEKLNPKIEVGLPW